MAILDPQPNIIKYSSQEASRCIAIYNISTTKTYKEVSQELGQRLGKLMLFMKMTSPKAYEDRLKGRTAYIVSTPQLWGYCLLIEKEFASLVDAVGAYQDFMDQSVTGYESANPEFWQEKSSIQASQKPYCPCLGWYVWCLSCGSSKLTVRQRGQKAEGGVRSSKHDTGHERGIQGRQQYHVGLGRWSSNHLSCLRLCRHLFGERISYRAFR